MPGYVYRPTYTDRRTGEKREQSVWWIGYSINGRKIRESARTTKKREAEAFLKRRLGEVYRGGPSPSDLAEVRFEDIAELVRQDYKRNGRKSLKRVEQAFNALSGHFAGFPVPAITPAEIGRYAGKRLRAGRAPATVNRELAALKRAFRLGYREQMVGRIPPIEMLQERNVRTGFVEFKDLWALLEVASPSLRPLIEVAYVTGWRKGELLSRNWGHVDFDEEWIRLEPGETKSDEGRQFPFTEHLRRVLEEQRAVATRLRLVSDRSPLFFRHEGRYKGKRIWSINKEWKDVRERAQVPDLLFHDFRRTAVRNLVRAGVDSVTAMKLTGHKTRSVFDRYAISDEAALREAGEKLDAAAGKAEARRQARARKRKSKQIS